jgi:hypothetical protein
VFTKSTTYFSKVPVKDVALTTYTYANKFVMPTVAIIVFTEMIVPGVLTGFFDAGPVYFPVPTKGELRV